MIEDVIGEKMVLRCECGARFEVDCPPDDPAVTAIFGDLRELWEGCRCEECLAKLKEQRREEGLQAELAELRYTLDRRLAATGAPEKFLRLTAPPVRGAAEWLWRNRTNPVLIAGATGSGKTSSAVFVLRQMMEKRKLKAQYFLLADLFAAFDAAQRGNGDQVFFFKRRLKNLDYLIVDEMVGKDGDVDLSPSHQGLIHWLLDGSYSADRFPKLWLLGEFYQGCFAKMLHNEESAIRRVRECFACGYISGGAVQGLAV